MSPGGRCGPQTNKMSRSAISASGSQIRKIRRPWLGSAGRAPAAGRASDAGHQDSTVMLPAM